jgi:Protein of unknown function (DUF551)
MQFVIALRLNYKILQNAFMSQYPPYETCNLGYAHILPEFKRLGTARNNLEKELESIMTVLALAKQALEQFVWMSVEDSLPEVGVEVLVCTKSGVFVSKRYIHYDNSIDWFHYWTYPTHWMALPELPK